MKIGELSQRTDTPVRMLRYYEEQGLIHSERLPNGYRSYEDYVVDRVRQVRGLLEVGLPTRIIKQILPCLDSSRAIYLPYVTPDMIATLEHERDRMAEKIECLTKNHRAINDYLDAVSHEIRAS
ncbi:MULTISPECIES: MerR family transcriptional regulator [Streptosporangium]|uniref:Transcriptional regulator, MerR family n=2 Tax=Streptosporangium TaxID=2000 RepID=D2AW60_STRRD|nr:MULTISPECIES: MerR family transcriptional regulator [Streptosporangium]ACZ85013.1 putative transcriptional regulator, MerR family [Streptosporangium roseum DSM 43021]SFJ63582.1 DNA-binding transcriptional regulator, MerR family [Streptosporangium canum]